MTLSTGLPLNSPALPIIASSLMSGFSNRFHLSFSMIHKFYCGPRWHSG